MQALRLVIWRDSVAAGDDVDAPHEWRLPTDELASVASVAEKVRAGYLANISGGRATWILEGTSSLAVIAQQWSTPRLLTQPDLPVWEVVRPDGQPHLFVRYLCQVDPERVLTCLREGQPPPDPDQFGR